MYFHFNQNFSAMEGRSEMFMKRDASLLSGENIKGFIMAQNMTGFCLEESLKLSDLCLSLSLNYFTVCKMGKLMAMKMTLIHTSEFVR